MVDFFAEVTDTFSGEANYSWVHRFRVKGCTTMMGAARKVGREMGYSFRKDWSSGDCIRYNAEGACICMFVSVWDRDGQEFLNVKELN